LVSIYDQRNTVPHIGIPSGSPISIRYWIAMAHSSPERDGSGGEITRDWEMEVVGVAWLRNRAFAAELPRSGDGCTKDLHQMPSCHFRI